MDKTLINGVLPLFVQKSSSKSNYHYFFLHIFIWTFSKRVTYYAIVKTIVGFLLRIKCGSERKFQLVSTCSRLHVNFAEMCPSQVSVQLRPTITINILQCTNISLKSVAFLFFWPIKACATWVFVILFDVCSFPYLSLFLVVRYCTYSNIAV